jgi:hypothetical protein
MEKPIPVKLSGIQVGVTGECLVAAELSRRGYVAVFGEADIVRDVR